jgi:hypothetical protein
LRFLRGEREMQVPFDYALRASLWMTLLFLY